MGSFLSSMFFVPYDSTFVESNTISRIVNIPIGIILLLVCVIALLLINRDRKVFRKCFVLNLTVFAIIVELILDLLSETRVIFPRPCFYSVGPTGSIGIPPYVTLAFSMSLWILQIIGYTSLFFFRYPATCIRRRPIPVARNKCMKRYSFIELYYIWLCVLPLVYVLLVVILGIAHNDRNGKLWDRRDFTSKGIQELRDYSCVDAEGWGMWFLIVALTYFMYLFIVVRVVADTFHHTVDPHDPRYTATVGTFVLELILPIIIMFIPLILSCIIYVIQGTGQYLITTSFYVMDSHLPAHLIVLASVIFHYRYELSQLWDRIRGRGGRHPASECS